MSDNQAASSTEFKEGRYLYCAVRVDDDPSLTVEGLDEGEVRIVERDGIGAVVQPVESMFDSDDLTEVRQWLLAHQRVVDAAGERFDTPVPFRFDTVIKGDDDRVREWVGDHATELREALDRLSGRWEYRIELLWNDSQAGEAISDDDEELIDLEERIAEASEGTGHLLEKQYEQRLSERLNARRSELAETLYDRVAEHADTVETVDQQTTLLGADGAETDDSGLETVVKLSVLAERDSEDPIGEVLEEFVSRDGFDVQYTGPWPPYSHAPSIGNGGEG